MLVAASCQGFFGSALASALLNFPLLLLYAPMFVAIEPSHSLLFAFFAALVAFAVWAPIGYLVVRVARARLTRPWGAAQQ